MTATVAKTKKPGRRKRIPGIVGFAAALGCNRDHLRRVLNAEISSPRLFARYRELQARRAAAAKDQSNEPHNRSHEARR